MDYARPLFSRLPPPAECLAILVGCAELSLFGIGGLANPLEFAKGYGLPITQSSTSAEDVEKRDGESKETRTSKALIAAIAARNIQNGLCILAFGLYWKDRRALGTVVMSGLITTAADAVLVHWYGASGALAGHLVGVVNSLAIGGALLYYNVNEMHMRV